MPVKIRFSRTGRKNRPYIRIVAVDSRKKRDGACLETVGAYDPIKHAIIQWHDERIQNWITKGAQCSPAVRKLMKNKAGQDKA